MTTEEWLAANLAAAPPLRPDQVTALRQIFRPVIPQITDAAPAAQRQEPRMPELSERT